MRTETRRWSSRSSPGGVRNVVRADEGRCNRATFPRVSCGRGREAGEPPTSWFTGWTTSANGLGSESDRDHGRTTTTHTATVTPTVNRSHGRTTSRRDDQRRW